MTLDFFCVTFDLINIWRNRYRIFDPSLVVIGLQLFKGDQNNKNLTKLQLTHTYIHIHTQKEFAIAISPYCFSSQGDKNWTAALEPPCIIIPCVSALFHSNARYLCFHLLYSHSQTQSSHPRWRVSWPIHQNFVWIKLTSQKRLVLCFNLFQPL